MASDIFQNEPREPSHLVHQLPVGSHALDADSAQALPLIESQPVGDGGPSSGPNSELDGGLSAISPNTHPFPPFLVSWSRSTPSGHSLHKRTLSMTSSGPSSRSYHIPRRSIAHGPGALGDASLLVDASEETGDVDPEYWDEVSLEPDGPSDQRKVKGGFLRFLVGSQDRGPHPSSLDQQALPSQHIPLQVQTTSNKQMRLATAASSKSAQPQPLLQNSTMGQLRLHREESLSRIRVEECGEGDGEEHLPFSGFGPHDSLRTWKQHDGSDNSRVGSDAVLYGDAESEAADASREAATGSRVFPRPATAAATAAYGYGVDEEDVDDEERSLRPGPKEYATRSRRSSHLHFEPLTRKEKVSYWATLVVVIALSVVAIGIGLDLIGELQVLLIGS